MIDIEQIEADTARWKALLSDPEFMDALMLGAPVHSPDWWERQPNEDPVLHMFRIFPLARPH